LPSGGAAVVTVDRENDTETMTGLAEGARARLKPEAVAGLAGRALSEGLPGQWIQPYWLWLAVYEAGGRLDLACEEGRVGLIARTPA
jgi:histidine phosphotransferase ChpT